jgi:hypothetical protein
MAVTTYKPGTQSAPFSRRELDEFEGVMRILSPTFAYDPAYVAFISAHNGGEPIERYFRLPDGDWMPIDRILNFADADTAPEEDLLFHVHQNWNDIEDRLRDGMFPFAALPGGDYLVFDSAAPPGARVAFWYHERSTEANPFLEPLADDFNAFVAGLRSTPSDI